MVEAVQVVDAFLRNGRVCVDVPVIVDRRRRCRGRRCAVIVHDLDDGMARDGRVRSQGEGGTCRQGGRKCDALGPVANAPARRVDPDALCARIGEVSNIARFETVIPDQDDAVAEREVHDGVVGQILQRSHKDIMSGASPQAIRSVSTNQHVFADPSHEGVAGIVAEQDVIASSRFDDLYAGPVADDDVGLVARGKRAREERDGLCRGLYVKGARRIGEARQNLECELSGRRRVLPAPRDLFGKNFKKGLQHDGQRALRLLPRVACQKRSETVQISGNVVVGGSENAAGLARIAVFGKEGCVLYGDVGHDLHGQVHIRAWTKQELPEPVVLEDTVIRGDSRREEAGHVL